MGLFFRKTKKIAPGVNVNLSKRGASFSVGPKGAKVSTRGRLSLSKGGFRFTRKQVSGSSARRDFTS
jgi:uncharacterized protein DUF4236